MFYNFDAIILSSLPSIRMPGSILGPITELMSMVYNALFNVLHGATTAGALGIAIIIFTLIVKFLLFPLTLKQQKSAFKMRLLQPEIESIKQKYAGKKDQLSQQKMALEIQDFQKENGISLLGGCLPLLLQLPILYALFYLFQNAYVYVEVIGNNYIDIAEAIIRIPEALRMEVFSPYAYDFIDTYQKTDIIKTSGFDLSVTNDIVMLVNYIKMSEWDTILMQLGSNGTELSALLDVRSNIETFLSIPLVSQAGLGFPGIFIPLIAGLTTFLQTKLAMNASSASNQDPDNPAVAMTKTMNYVMPLMMGFFCITMPAGLGLYWIVGNIFGIVQQLILQKVFANQTS